MNKPKIHLFVDNSNVLIEGRRLSYAKRFNGGQRNTSVDQTYELDWGKFLHLVKSRNDRLLSQLPTLYGSTPPPDDTVWKEIRDEGFDVKLFERNIRNQEKGVDLEMGMDIAERTLLVKPPETIVIVAGDGDFLGAVERAKNRGWNVEVWFWGNASAKMRDIAEFVNMDQAWEYLKKGGGVALPPQL